MSDGLRVLNQAKKINEIQNTKIRLYTSAPICSKTIEFLKKNNIDIDSI